MSIPHTVRFPDWARKPQASMLKVRNDGAVNNGENAASSVISDAGTGTAASGSISGNPFRQQVSGHGWRLPPAIMDSVPQTPDQQTRNAVTRRIIAHVTAGWPRLHGVPPWGQTYLAVLAWAGAPEVPGGEQGRLPRGTRSTAVAW